MLVVRIIGNKIPFTEFKYLSKPMAIVTFRKLYEICDHTFIPGLDHSTKMHLQTAITLYSYSLLDIFVKKKTYF